MDYSQIEPVKGGSLEKGRAYHNIVGIDGPVHRSDTEQRVRFILEHFDPDGLVGVDLGCSVGGISLGLAEAGAEMYGYDHDMAAVMTGNLVAEARSVECCLAYDDLTDPGAWDRVATVEPDFVIWLSNWMWLAAAKGREFAESRLQFVSDMSPVLIFETAESPSSSMAGSAGINNVEDVARLLAEHTDYYRITNLGPVPDDPWYRRSMFLCETMEP